MLPYLGFIGVALQTGEFIQPAQKPFGGALPQGDVEISVSIWPPNHQHRAILHPPLGFGQADGELGLLPFPIGYAQEVEGAVTAVGIPAGRADKRPQLDEALGEISRILFGYVGRQGILGVLLGGGGKNIRGIPRQYM